MPEEYEGGPPRPRKSAARAERYVTAAYLAAYAQAARTVDIEPYHQLRQAKLPIDFIGDPQLRVPRERFLALLETSTEVAGRDDFILRVIAALSLAALGPVAILARSQATVRDALEVLCRHTAQAPGAGRAVLEPGETTTTLRFALKVGPGRQTRRSAELALGMGLRAMQGLIGATWRPRATSFTASAPRDVRPYERLFGPVRFDQLFDAMIIDSEDMARPLTTADASLARLAEHHLRADDAPSTASFLDEVSELIVALLPRGVCTIERLCQHLGVDRRTVHRRLSEHGATFSDLVEAARREGAATALADPAIPIAVIARTLGFSSTSTFSRWFRQAYGAAPRSFRKVAEAGL